MTSPHRPLYKVRNETQGAATLRLYRYECACGWQAKAWHGSKRQARTHYDDHARREG